MAPDQCTVFHRVKHGASSGLAFMATLLIESPNDFDRAVDATATYTPAGTMTQSSKAFFSFQEGFNMDPDLLSQPTGFRIRSCNLRSTFYNNLRNEKLQAAEDHCGISRSRFLAH